MITEYLFAYFCSVKPLDLAKKEKIIKAVYAITARTGLAGINVAEISKESKVAVASIYTYFKGKDEIIQVAYESVKDKFSHYTYDDFDNKKSIRESVKKMYIRFLNYRLRNFEESVFVDLYRQSSYLRINIDEQTSDYIKKNQPFYDLLKRGQEEGIIADINRVMMIGFALAVSRHSAIAISQKILPMSKRTVEDGFSMVWKGLKV